MEYRGRVYGTYISTHWRYTHSMKVAEYEHLAKIFRRRFSRFLPGDKGADIIDLPCGAGHFSYFLQKEGYAKARGLDISEEAVKAARMMGVERVEVGDLFQFLPMNKEKFDFISANDIIEHLKKEEVLGFLDLIYAALRPGGTALMATVNAGALFGGKSLFVDFTHETGFTAVSLGQVFRVAGFVDVAVYGECPVVHSPGSAIRAALWKVVKGIIYAYLMVEGSTGFGVWKRHILLEPRMFAVGKKPGG